MNLQRMAKITFSGFLGQGVSVVTQILVPPFFLRYYGGGILAYGEWIALSASINYLGMLNSGIQSYANTEMTIRYNAGDKQGAKVIQASALRLLFGIVLAFAVVSLIVFAMPISALLKLHQVTPLGAQLTLYLLILQITLNMLFSFLASSFMMVGQPHYNNYWTSGQRLFSTICLSIAIFLRKPFPELAAVQLGSLLLFSIFVLSFIRLRVPELAPHVRFATWRDTVAIMKPSGHFGMISLGGFLTWALPVVLIQRTLGAEVTGLFGLVRAVFQMSRQILMIASGAISQDITEMWGRRNLPQLRKLYDLSERVVLFLIPVVTVGTLLLSPLLFTLWLHKRGMYQPQLCFMMAVISGVLGIKEHKTQFQSSSNEHEKMSWIIVIGYSCMLLIAFFVMKSFGLTGYLSIWLAWEIVQTYLILRLNEQLFPVHLRVTAGPLIKMVLFTLVTFSLMAYPAILEERLSLFRGVALAIGVVSILAAAAFQLFGLRDVVRILQSRMKNRF